MFHTAPTIAPTPGFVVRFEARLAYQQEQRRQAMVWVLLSIGVISLTILALPSLISVLGFAGRLVLPHETISYMQGLLNWVYIVIYALVDAASVLLRHFVSTPTGLACIASAAVTGTLILIWTRLLVGRMAAQGTR
jgi:hypothetical protein